MAKCSCGAELVEGTKFCDRCGQNVQEILRGAQDMSLLPPAGCPRCGVPTLPEADFCGACGSALTVQGVIDKLKKKAGAAKDSMDEVATVLQDAGLEKIKEGLTEFNSYLPILKEVGFEIVEAEIVVGLPPKIIAHFKNINDVNGDKLCEILQKNQDKKLLAMIANFLTHSPVKIGSLRFSDIKIELGAIPNIVIRLG